MTGVRDDERVECFPCRPIETAPAEGNFLAENMHGDWMVVRRFDPAKPGDFSANAVINGRTGRWWYARLWMPLLTARDEFPTEGGRA